MKLTSALIVFIKPLILVVLFFTALFFTLHAGEVSDKNINQVSTRILPVRLIIPQIKVAANIEAVGVTSDGVMDTPSKSAIVGWFKLGSLPGEKGSAVISGHVDGEYGEAGVFANLGKLKKGDRIYTKDSAGFSVLFVVREKRLYDPGFADDVFSSNNGAQLNLITCDGVWDGFKKSYSKRLVVFADKVGPEKFMN